MAIPIVPIALAVGVGVLALTLGGKKSKAKEPPKSKLPPVPLVPGAERFLPPVNAPPNVRNFFANGMAAVEAGNLAAAQTTVDNLRAIGQHDLANGLQTALERKRSAARSPDVTSPGLPPMPSPPSPTLPAPAPSPDKRLPPDLLQKMAAAIRDGTPQALTTTAFELRKAGFPEAAAALENEAKKIKSRLPPPPPAVTPANTIEPGMPKALSDKVAEWLQHMGDPDKLEALAGELEQRGFKKAAALLRAKASEIRNTIDVGDTIDKIDKVIRDVPGAVPGPPPVVRPPVVTTPPVVVRPQQSPAEALNQHLMTRSRAGQSKPKYDAELVKAFQRSQGLAADGKPGRGTMIKLAELGVSNMAPVYFWPRKNSGLAVSEYKRKLNQLASSAEAAGDFTRASELRASASRERGNPPF